MHRVYGKALVVFQFLFPSVFLQTCFINLYHVSSSILKTLQQDFFFNVIIYILISFLPYITLLHYFINITFFFFVLNVKIVLGDLPLLSSDITSLTGSPAIVISETTKGTKEDSECSNRGMCDELTGICGCTYGYTSSDGNGNGGSRGDCGHINAFQSAAAHPVAAAAEA